MNIFKRLVELKIHTQHLLNYLIDLKV